MVERMTEALEDAKSHVLTTNIRMKRGANNSRRDETFKDEQEVVYKTKYLHQVDFYLPTKLRLHWVGPFTAPT